MKIGYLGWAGLTTSILLVAFSLQFRLSDRGAPTAEPARSPSAARKSKLELQPGQSVVGRDATFWMKSPKDGVTWKVQAESAFYREDDKRVNGTNVRCTLFDDRRKPTATLVARGVLMDPETSDLWFQGAVRSTSPKGDWLTAQRLRYDGKKRKFYGHGGVRVRRGTSIFTGDSMVGDTTLRQVTLHGRVRGDGLLPTEPRR